MLVSEKAKIRVAVQHDDQGIHDAHMRSIREVCINDHGESEVQGWGYRELGDRWVAPIRDGHVWVVELQGKIEGLAYIRIDHMSKPKTAYIHALYLTPAVIGLGYGCKLMQLMLDVAIQNKIVKINLDSSITAHRFYQSFGFRDLGSAKQQKIGGHPVTSYPMQLDLEKKADHEK
jgi:predicted GNAT family N-acyltransferase